MSVDGVSGVSPLNLPVDVSPKSFSMAMSEAEEKNTVMGDTLASMHFFDQQIFNPISDEEADLRAVG